MSCNKSKQIVIEEMTALLLFIDNENTELEREKNELKIKFHQRPAEERNIMKDILAMHTEFESDLLQLKQIADNFSSIPPGKNEITNATEEKIEKLAKMQEEIVLFHEQVQKLLLTKASYSLENEKINQELEVTTKLLSELTEKIKEIESYEDMNVFIERVNSLESECDRISDLIKTLDQRNGIDFNGIKSSEIPLLSEAKALFLLKKITNYNSILQKEISGYGEIVQKLEEEKNIAKKIQETKENIKRKKEVCEQIEREIEEFTKTSEGIEGDYLLKIDEIIRKKKSGKIESIKSKSRLGNRDFLDQIEESLAKVRAIPSPSKFK